MSNNLLKKGIIKFPKIEEILTVQEQQKPKIELKILHGGEVLYSLLFSTIEQLQQSN